MRILPLEEQEDRKRKLLQAVIHEFIKTGKPVGSQAVVEQYRLGLSSATIRNIMAELEEEGFLTHPHTSAGRVPTDRAYRFYVDSVVEFQRLARLEEERLRHEYEARVREIEELMLSASRTLSALSHYTGFVLAPGMEQARLQHLELVPLDPHRLLAVLVSDAGHVKNRVVLFEDPFPAEFLRPLARMLNEQLRGQSYQEARDTLVDHIEAFAQKQADLAAWARRIARDAFGSLEDGDLYLDGAGNILSLPDFQDQEQMRGLVRLLDEKKTLGSLIARDIDAGARGKVRVRIGEENLSPDLKGLSVVSSAYSAKGRTVGVLGIIGPKRMEYSRMMGLVGRVSEVVSRVLGRLAGE